MREIGLVVKNQKNEIVDEPELWKKLKNDNNFFKAVKTLIPDLSYPELFNCNTPMYITPLPEGLPAVCGDNPIICRNPHNFRVYLDDLIFPINANNIFIRGNKLKDFMSTVKVLIDLIIFKQAKYYMSCTDQGYIERLHDLFEKNFNDLNDVRKHVFDQILE